VQAHAHSAADAFTACLRLFRRFPLAVRRHYAEHRYGSMVLMNRETGQPRHFVLIMEWDDCFVIRPWDRRDGSFRRTEIRRGEPSPQELLRLVEASVPVPRDGALLGWVVEGGVRAVLAAYGRLPEPWDDSSAVPGVLVLPLVGSKPAHWPPLGADPLESGRLWEYLDRGQLADLGSLVARKTGHVFWVPGAPGGGRPDVHIVVTELLGTSGLWLPSGVYADHWAVRAGAAVPSPSELLSRPGVVDLARGTPVAAVHSA
jgi:hypothetical protein